MDPLTPASGYILSALHVPAFIACILCYKYRWLADYFFQAEILIQCCATVHLNYASYTVDFKELTTRIIQHYIQYSMATRYDVFTSAIGSGFQMFVGINLVYNRPLTASTISLYVFTILMTGFGAILCNMVLIFISEVFKKLKSSEKASVNLLNGMHEGLLILSQIKEKESM